MSTPNEPELTQEAKAAIRDYMLKLVTLPAVFISVALFFVGYFAKDVFGAKAENAAYATASAKILDMTAAATQAQAEATTAKDQASEAITHARRTTEQLDLAAKQVDDLLAKQRANISQTSTEVTQQLLKEPKFLESFLRVDTLANYVRVDQPYVLRSATGNFALDVKDGDQGVKDRQAVQVAYPNEDKAQDWYITPKK